VAPVPAISSLPLVNRGSSGKFSRSRQLPSKKEIPNKMSARFMMLKTIDFLCSRMKNLPDPFSIDSEAAFTEAALAIFHYQAEHCHIYRRYLQAINVAPHSIQHPAHIPYLPIGFFKTHEVVAGDFVPEITFTSSGTSGTNTSRHHVRQIDTYRKAFQHAFELQYGSPSNYVICALLPSYLEREGSSLILMTEELIAQAQPGSGFFLKHHEELQSLLMANEAAGKKNLLLGVTFALLDFAEAMPTALPNTIIMETGGMKGRRKELIREEVHRILKKAFHTEHIHSEYGMTELLSQAYSQGEGIFRCPPWMRLTVRDVQDPLSNYATGKGGLNIIDLANIDSCAFIATQDLGIVHPNGTFEVTGRFDHADVRGCNLMVM
jgi:phenylacetate-coenzyme A ligase PaaK-like adenylate-forming protein